MNQAKHEAKRNQIIKSTVNVMRQIGYEETSIRAICEAADISIGTFYHYFKDKSELLNIILRQIDIFLDEKVTPTLTDASDTINLKNFAIGFARETYISAQEYGGVISGPNIPLPNSPMEILSEHERPLYQIPKQIILHGQGTGEFLSSYDADNLVEKLITCLRGISMDWSRRDFLYNIEENVSSFMDIFCNAILTVRIP